MPALDILRIALLITLPITLVAVLWKKFKQRTLRNDMPAPSHAELIGLEVAYHPARLKVWVKTPANEIIGTALLNGEHREIQAWEPQAMPPGEQWIERSVDSLADGSYYFELSTATQRTERLFHLRRS